jgi:proline racemase
MKNTSKNNKKITYKVTYDKFIGGEGFILVKAETESQAISNAKNLCATGKNFRNATETTEEYIKPRKQGFAGYN